MKNIKNNGFGIWYDNNSGMNYLELYVEQIDDDPFVDAEEFILLLQRVDVSIETNHLMVHAYSEELIETIDHICSCSEMTSSSKAYFCKKLGYIENEIQTYTLCNSYLQAAKKTGKKDYIMFALSRVKDILEQNGIDNNNDDQGREMQY